MGAETKSGLCICCEKCPNRRINQKYCYNGKSLNECPAYSLPDSPSNEPPADIDNMLNS